ncbi:active regulator of SIRT1 isoform X1 [Ciconia boyciana]|uniref:active regulator of SIRT1 isoform X1 n=1 Tax=Ciconia boyciana TaxID=52775 RepID=UPI003BA39D8B
MSASLLRRGLELLEAPGRGKAPPGLQRGRDGPRTAGAARRRKSAPEPGRNKATVKGRVVKSAIEEYHKKAAVNHLRANLQYMLKRQFVANKAITEQVRLSLLWGLLLLRNTGSCSEQRQEVQRSASKEGSKEEARGHCLYRGRFP